MLAHADISQAKNVKKTKLYADKLKNQTVYSASTMNGRPTRVAVYGDTSHDLIPAHHNGIK
jgi:hypothetical protein